MYRFLFVFIALVLCQHTYSQDSITLEAIWKDYSLSHNTVPGFNFMKDGKHYTRKIDETIVKYDIITGEKVETLWDAGAFKGMSGFDGEFDRYEFVADEAMILITDNVSRIYRHSYTADYFLVDPKKKTVKRINDLGQIQYATLCPQNRNMAYVFQNNVYYKDLLTNKVVQVTKDGRYNQIINGAADWVYEEEFAFHQGFHWNEDGSMLAYLKFDESEVPTFSMEYYTNAMYPKIYEFKYPKVGERNATVSVYTYDLDKAKNTRVDLSADPEMYIPRIKWTKDPNKLCVFHMNRHQNDLNLYLVDAKKGKKKLLYNEKSKYYIDITDNLTFLDDGESFIWTSEISGYNHIYLYDMKGRLKKQLTDGNWDVDAYLGMDAVNNDIYYRASDKGPHYKHIYRLNIDSGNKTALTPDLGTNRTQFSSTYDYYVNTYSTINTPPVYTVHNRSGEVIRIIEDNDETARRMQSMNLGQIEFFDFKNSGGTKLNGWMLKPADFDPSKQYPVFMYLYGGPGSQQVVDSWKGSYYWWFQMLADKGYIVACVDNRGTGARGEEFKKMTYLQLGKYETEDQIDAAKYLAKLPYTDGSRIGIFGWSYGGYMSSLCLLKGNDVFKSAIAVAPVTNWKWYDTIYTERYMRTYAENQEGFDDNSPINFVDRLEGNYLLVHGMADDNVHMQHTTEMTAALIKANKQFDTYLYPNRNHGIYGNNARLHLFTKMTNFIEEKL